MATDPFWNASSALFALVGTLRTTTYYKFLILTKIAYVDIQTATKKAEVAIFIIIGFRKYNLQQCVEYISKNIYGALHVNP